MGDTGSPGALVTGMLSSSMESGFRQTTITRRRCNFLKIKQYDPSLYQKLLTLLSCGAVYLCKKVKSPIGPIKAHQAGAYLRFLILVHRRLLPPRILSGLSPKPFTGGWREA